MHKSIVLCDELSPDYLQDIEKFLSEWTSAEKTIQVQTSGSTGIPKKIILEKDKVRASARATGTFFRFQPNQTLLLNLSPNYIAGKLMIVRALEFGMQILVGPNQKNPLKNIADRKIDFAAFVPYQVEAILGDEDTALKYQQIPNVIIGGGVVSATLEQKIQRLSNQSYATFGMTETITHFALRNISRNERFYTCLPGITVRQDERGCLIINKNQVTAELQTNDLIEPINPNQFVWKGRVDNVVNSGGVKLSPELIERKIVHLMGARRFFFTGRASKQFGEELVMVVEGKQPQNWKELEQHLFTFLDKYEKPKAVLFKTSFKETPTGKVIRSLD